MIEAAIANVDRFSGERVEERDESRSAYEDDDGEEAADLVAGVFPELMLEPTWEPFEPPEGTEVVRFLGDSSAIVAPEGAGAEAPSELDDETISDPDLLPDGAKGTALVESTIPIRAENDEGKMRPVDPELETEDSDLEPVNAVVEAESPVDLADGIELPEVGVTVAPEGAENAAEREVVGPDKLFYADLETDTDFISTPTPRGVETFYQLRSAQSPEQFELALELPAGATLEEGERGGATIEGPDGPIALVQPPLAFDAEGTPVPLATSVEGDSIFLQVDHQGGDFLYPLLVDPIIEAYDWYQNDATCPGIGSSGNPYWRWETNHADKFASGCTGTFGIINATQAGKTFSGYYAYSHWLWQTPENTFIEKAEFDGTYHGASASCAALGIYSAASSSWQASNIGESNWCQTWSNSDRSYTVGSSADPATPGDAQGDDGNSAVVQLLIPGPAASPSAATFTRAARFTVYDRNDPTFTSTPPADADWSDDRVGGVPQDHQHTVSATDPGLGMKTFALLYPDPNNPAQLKIDVADRSCSGTRGSNPCTAPKSWSKGFNYQLPEGNNDVAVIAYDQIGRMDAETYAWKVPVDRSGPDIGAPTGSLVDEKDNIVSTAPYELSVTATDGSEESNALMRSGVERVEIFLDEESEPRFVKERECNGQAGSCPDEMMATWELDLGEEVQALEDGTHTAQVVAVDAVGNDTAVEFDFFVRTESDEPDVDVTLGDPEPSGEFEVAVEATDGEAVEGQAEDPDYGSGVESIEVLVDGEPPSSLLVDEQPVSDPGDPVDIGGDCPEGGCDASVDLTLPANASPDQHEVAVITFDHYGNESIELLGAAVGYPSGMGYNDKYSSLNSVGQDAILGHTAQGEGSVVRFPVTWCGITQNAGQGSPPNQWAWGPYDTLIKQHLASKEMQFIPVLFNAPGWAQTSGEPSDPIGQPCSKSHPPKPGHDAEWGEFVGAFIDRYKDDGLTAIEVWNEPNFADFWGGTRSPERFADLVQVAYDEVEERELENVITVVPGGLSPHQNADNTWEYTADYLDALGQGNPAVGAVSVHLYAKRRVRSDRKAREQIAAQFFSVAVMHGSRGYTSPGTPVWITEVGFPESIDGWTGKRAANKFTQRRRLCSAYVRMRAAKMFIVHRLYDDAVKEDGAHFGTYDVVAGQGRQAFRVLRDLATGEQNLRCDDF